MKTNFTKHATLFAATLVLAACATPGGEGGGLTSALAYGKLNSVMDANDKDKAVTAIRANVTDSWTNAGNGNQFTFTPTRTFTGDMGTCRDYRIDAKVGGQPQSVVGTACTGPRGFWQPSNVK